jgi:NhaP-type Na+/H+ or K+/H+ antiporter
MQSLSEHLGFIGVLVLLIAICILCEYARRALKEKPKTLKWKLLTVINFIIYGLSILFLVFNMLTEIII